MSGTDTSEADVMPIVIHRSVNKDGETFALEPGSRKRLRACFGDLVPSHPRIFIAHDTRADFDHVHGDFAPQVVALLTGVSEERLKALGGVIFRDPVTEQDLQRTPATRLLPG